MTQQKPALSLSYVLSLEESQDGFKLATFGKKQITQFITPLISIGLIIWGIYLGFGGMGRYYVGLGVLFLIMQLVVRYMVLPFVFKRQFIKFQLGKNEQFFQLFQNQVVVSSQGRSRTFEYTDVKRFDEGKLTYILELKSRTVLVVPKRVFQTAKDKTLFENSFK